MARATWSWTQSSTLMVSDEHESRWITSNVPSGSLIAHSEKAHSLFGLDTHWSFARTPRHVVQPSISAPGHLACTSVSTDSTGCVHVKPTTTSEGAAPPSLAIMACQ
eukprot:242049-Prymnesium_polylepis.1